jgi:hypothetical protein
MGKSKVNSKAPQFAQDFCWLYHIMALLYHWYINKSEMKWTGSASEPWLQIPPSNSHLSCDWETQFVAPTGSPFVVYMVLLGAKKPRKWVKQKVTPQLVAAGLVLLTLTIIDIYMYIYIYIYQWGI